MPLTGMLSIASKFEFTLFYINANFITEKLSPNHVISRSHYNMTPCYGLGADMTDHPDVLEQSEHVQND